MPVALHGAYGDAERLGDFLLRQPPEKAALDHVRQPRLNLGEPVHRFVKLQERLGLIVDGDLLFVQRYAPLHAAPLERHTRLGPIDQDVPHGHRRQCQKVRTVAPRRSRMIDELEIGLVHESRRLQRSAPASCGQLPMGNPAQLLVHHGAADRVIRGCCHELVSMSAVDSDRSSRSSIMTMSEFSRTRSKTSCLPSGETSKRWSDSPRRSRVSGRSFPVSRSNRWKSCRRIPPCFTMSCLPPGRNR